MRIYQGAADGTLYYISENASKLNIVSNLPVCIGQDGTGRYQHTFDGVIDEFSMWSRSISHSDVRMIFESNRKGYTLGDMLLAE